MKHVDIREFTGKGHHIGVKTITSQIRLHKNRVEDNRGVEKIVHVKYRSWVAFRVGTKDGWFVFNRLLKSKKLGKKWYTGYSMIFSKAISKARKTYNVPIPHGSWEVVTVKHYNLTNILKHKTITFIINELNQ